MTTLPDKPAELVVTGVVRAGLGADETVEALGIVDGVVVTSGLREEVEAAAAPNAERLVCPTGVVLPGFVDTHMHLEKIAAELAMLQLGDAESVDEILEQVAGATAAAPEGEWIQSFGDDNAWHESRLQEQRLPTREELDRAAPLHPVYLYRGWDAAALNTRAVQLLAAALADDAGWDAEEGHLHSPLARTLQETLPAPGEIERVLAAGSQSLLELGITTIVDPGLPSRFEETWQLYDRCRRRRLVHQRLYLMDRLDHRRPFEQELTRSTHSEIARDAEADGLHGWGLKLLVDGEFANAWMRPGEPQAVPPLKRHSIEQLDQALLVAREQSWPICFHVMGGGAVDAVIEAVQRAGGPAAFAPSQVSLAHAFHASQANIADCAQLGIAISVQPMLAYAFEREMLDAWGELAHATNPYRQMIESGVVVAGGSDVLPCEPLRGAAVAVNRKSRLGTELGRDEAIPPAQAISLFTDRAGGYVQQQNLGTLNVGAPADFASWPVDPLDVAVDVWPELRPSFTAVAGKVVWQDQSDPQPNQALERSNP